MNKYLQKLIKILAYLGAGTVIVLAIAVGIFRLMLPRLPEYQDEIKDWASAAIGLDVQFSGMNARWRLSGPELSFFDAALQRIDGGESLIQAAEVSIGVGLFRLISDRELVVDRVSIRDAAIDVRQDERGVWLVQGVSLEEFLGAREASTSSGGEVEIVGQNIAVQYEHPESGQLVSFNVDSFNVKRGQSELMLKAEIGLPSEFGDRLELSASQLDADFDDSTWRFFVEGESLNMSGFSRLQPVGLPEIDSGTVEHLNLWVDVADGVIQSATANLIVTNMHARGPGILAPFGVRGVFEFSSEANGWVLGANQLRFSTVNGDWPESELQLRVINNEDGSIDGLRTSASYFDLNDLRYVTAWLPKERRDFFAQYNPIGVLRDVNVELANLQSADPEFDVSADLRSAGVTAVDSRPGIEGFSGRVRADRDGGRVEIESTDLAISISEHLADPLLLDDAFGTVIWRRNRDGMIVLSDSVRVRNAEFDSQLSLQLGLPDGDAAPVIDFESSWSVYDVSAMHRYLPLKIITPQLRKWLSDALVSGHVTRGTTRFNGALDQFPFDDGQGQFRIDARLENATLQYSEKWPAAEFHHLDIIVDNTRLYSHVNSAVNLGNSIENARIEIADIRSPILTIDAFATGTLESIQEYVENSPIDDVLGGQVDRVTVDGDASFDLSISYPIQDKENYDFSTKIRISDGMFLVQGFAAPITEINGVVYLSRQDTSSESLFGHFLGQSVDLDLQRIGDDLAPHSVLLQAAGRTTSASLAGELDIPIDGVLQGELGYTASVLFPNGRATTPGPLQIQIDTDLVGMRAELPAPLGKTEQYPMPMSFNIEFPRENHITTAGNVGDDLSWTGSFLKQEDRWDFDRGVLAVGGEYPQDADVRGLHIHGQTPLLDLHAWLAAGREGDREIGLGDRIRSINLDVEAFYAIGQKFTDHRIEVNRGGQGWRVQISGEEANGLVSVPYDFSSQRAMTLEMDRLILPGDEESPTDENAKNFLDPRSLPGISIRAAEFGIGARRLGQLEVDFGKTDIGLEALNLKSTDPTYAITGTAGWVIDTKTASGQRTYFNAELKSTDTKETFARLDYESGIIGAEMLVDFEVQWDGGPRKDFMELLEGNVAVRLGEGRLADVEPGAGRVFGLMSFTALPRRLALDFRDVFDSGFSFDEITGNFRLKEGNAFTCDLTVAGTAADVGIVGRTGLVAGDYDQSAVVSANVGNTLPVVGGILGGPQVAAALFVFSRIFKKPLQDVGQAYYAVEGSWDDPAIDRADSQRFVDASSLAKCFPDSE